MVIVQNIHKQKIHHVLSTYKVTNHLFLNILIFFLKVHNTRMIRFTILHFLREGGIFIIS